MIQLIIKAFIKNSENISDSHVREKYGILSGILGLCCNLLLFLTKITIGFFINSIAVITDAFNNLSDCGSSAISIIGAKMSGRRPDREHPFGHGRFEYISALMISFVIMFVGVELFKTALDKVIHPESVNLNIIMLIILALSVFVKVWMYSYNRYIGKKISSDVNFATAADSINDVIATSAVILSTGIGFFLHLKIDGYVGVLVAILVIFSGYKIAKNTVSILLGKPPEKELVEKICLILLNDSNIRGVHDLIIHDYGPGRVIASVHAEVPDDADMVKIHEVIDETEQKIKNELGVEIVIHMDPISINCQETEELKKKAMRIAAEVDNRITLHDFRITKGQNRINLIFDMVVPRDMNEKRKNTVAEEFQQILSEQDSRLHSVINVETGFLD